MASSSKPPRPTLKTTRGAAFGSLEPVFEDVWWAWGTTRMAPGTTFPRNMVVIREPDGLVVVHPVLLPEAEQFRLDALGPVKHILRLGEFHGMDDALYIERYAPTVWAPAGVLLGPGTHVDETLRPGGPLPLAGARLLAFERSAHPEAVLHLARHGGLLLTCDSVQCWGSLPAGTSFLGGVAARLLGFRGDACIGPAWRRTCEPKDGVGFEPAFRAILDLEWRHLVSAHGAPLLDTAHAALARAVDRAYPRG